MRVCMCGLLEVGGCIWNLHPPMAATFQPVTGIVLFLSEANYSVSTMPVLEQVRDTP